MTPERLAEIRVRWVPTSGHLLPAYAYNRIVEAEEVVPALLNEIERLRAALQEIDDGRFYGADRIAHAALSGTTV